VSGAVLLRVVNTCAARKAGLLHLHGSWTSQYQRHRLSHPSNADAPSPAVKLVAETVNKANCCWSCREAGIEIDDETRDAILTARTASDAGNVTEQTTPAAQSIHRLAARVRPSRWIA